MKKLITVMVFAFSVQLCFGQTQAELDKKMAAAQQQIEKMKKDPRYAEALKNLPNMDSLMKLQQKGNIGSTSKTKIPDTSFGALPSANQVLLNALPLRTFNKAELVSYVHNLNLKLTE